MQRARRGARQHSTSGDRRLNRRAQRLVESLGKQPTLSIPGACSGWDETRAAYRLFDHDAVTAEAVLAPHIACTEARLRAHPRVLCIQDTTELDYTKKKGVIGGLGVLNLESRRGLYLHPTLVVTPERVPLGLLDAHRLARASRAVSASRRIGAARWKTKRVHVGSMASPGSMPWPSVSPRRARSTSPIAKATSTICSSRRRAPRPAPTG
jgi:hypothetical protein